MQAQAALAMTNGKTEGVYGAERCNFIETAKRRSSGIPPTESVAMIIGAYRYLPMLIVNRSAFFKRSLAIGIFSLNAIR